MTHTYENGAIVAHGAAYEPAVYHVSNESLSAVFDGSGATVSYALANEQDFLSGELFFSLYANGVPIDPYAKKTVTMCARRQIVCIEDDALGTVEITLFLDRSINGVFTSYRFTPKTKGTILTVGLYHKAGWQVERGIACQKNGVLAATSTLLYREENQTLYISVPSFTATFFSFGMKAGEATEILGKFDTYAAHCEKEIANVHIPDGLNEVERAQYLSCYFCALETYKVKGDYRAFMAGHRYLIPMRSYYRDSYYTVLPMYAEHPELVRHQILTLARGIARDGHCPSAVRYGYEAFWGNHFDSPSFFVMMLYDYVRVIGDDTVLTERLPDGVTVFDKAVLALSALSTFEDDTGLLYKAGPFNRRDWADEVNRIGYVTYDEILYARAWHSLSMLYRRVNDLEKADACEQKFRNVCLAINDILWDEKRGYYVNFKTRDYTEDNLSVDTVFAAIFGIADEHRARRMLAAMESILESRNNRKQKAGDFGVMSVYPFYRGGETAVKKSATPYYYHNGANWPYLSSMYAYAKRTYGMEYRYALESWFTYNVARGNYTPIEFFSPPMPDGSLLQGWSGNAAFVLDEKTSIPFFDD